MTAYRFVCPFCGEGMFNLRGSPTREKAAEHWNTGVRIRREIADEAEKSHKIGK